MSSSSTPLGVATPDIVKMPAPPSLPSADAFDFIPLTYDLLARVNVQFSSSIPPTTSVPSGGSIEVKEVDAEASRIRLKIQKARTLVSELPDVGRTLEEQEAEIRELEEKVARQREILGGVRSLEAVKQAAGISNGMKETA